jgi:hypothetical protein
METLFPCLDAEHLSLFEVRIKAITASALGVFGTGAQLEDELMQSICSKAPKAADLVEVSISAYREWTEACQSEAPNDVIEKSRNKALQSSKELQDYVKHSN